MVVPQAAFVAAQAFGKMRQRDIECRIGVIGLFMGANMDATSDMHADRGPNSEAFARENDGGLDRVGEILLGGVRDRILDMGAQGVAHVNLLSGNGYLHSRNTGWLLKL